MVRIRRAGYPVPVSQGAWIPANLADCALDRGKCKNFHQRLVGYDAGIVSRSP
jgi:hypothetical protein